MFRSGVRLLAWIVLGRRLHIEGMRNIPRHGAVLIVGNHVGTVDPALTGVFIPRLDVYYMAKSDLFRKPALGWLFRRNHAFPVVRGSADRTALRFALRTLADGHVLLVYPEGTRSWDGGLVQQTHGGAGFIARHSSATVIPVASWGSERVIPRGSWIPRRTDVHLRIGTPFRLPARSGNGRALSNQEAAALMMDRVTALLPPSERVRIDGGLSGGGSPPAA